jgi:regulatory protein
VTPDYLISGFSKGPERGLVTILVGGEPALAVSRSTIEQLDLREGQSLDPQKQEQVRHYSDLQQTRTLAVQALGRRSYSRRGLGQRLQRRGLPETAIAETLEWLADKGYLDDEQFARSRLVTLTARQLGASGLIHKLVAEGVARELAEQVVAEQAETFPETERACALAQRQARRLAGLEWSRQRARIYQYLARRGYGSDDIHTALAQIEPADEASAEF